MTPNAVAGDPIEVTALDAPTPAAAPVATEEVAPAEEATPPAPEAEPAVAVTEPTALPDAEATAVDAAVTGEAAATEAASDETEAAPPPPPKSELQIACERKRGDWVATSGGRMFCQLTTRDGGKSCTRESQCEGLCLARSGTCAPVTPLMGCQEILQDDGSRATQCIE
jgi:hypothetical protein